ncbi:nucleotide exchange factor GrpE [Candidatus Woesearchaeota archaeon]|nr:nucleotide exchange factor GrpE [Candidatus Woesearchaeota archaeon]
MAQTNQPKKNMQKDKIDALKKKLDDKEIKLEEYKKNLIRLQADFENYIKRANKEKNEIIKLANGNLIRELLIILDDFEMAIQKIEDEKNKEGLMLLHKNFFKILENQGLKQIESLGKKLNPYLHEVIKSVNSDKEENEIIEEIQKGYVLHNGVLRPSKVIISKKTPKKEVVQEVQSSEVNQNE